jgi:hypothetical protein
MAVRSVFNLSKQNYVTECCYRDVTYFPDFVVPMRPYHIAPSTKKRPQNYQTYEDINTSAAATIIALL